jgi:hypothetical protein
MLVKIAKKVLHGDMNTGYRTRTGFEQIHREQTQKAKPEKLKYSRWWKELKSQQQRFRQVLSILVSLCSCLFLWRPLSY